MALSKTLTSVHPLRSRKVLLAAEPALIGELKQVGKPSEKDNVQNRSQAPGGVVPITAGSFARICIMSSFSCVTMRLNGIGPVGWKKNDSGGKGCGNSFDLCF